MVDEYFGLICTPPFNVYSCFAKIPSDKIVLYRRTKTDLNLMWNRFGAKSSKVQGHYYGRPFYLIYSNDNEIYLLVDSLLEHQFVDDIKHVIEHDMLP